MRAQNGAGEQDFSNIVLSAMVMHALSQDDRPASIVGISESTCPWFQRVKSMLILVVKWNRPDVADQILSELCEVYGTAGIGSSSAMRAALQMAVELQRADIVSKLLEPPGGRLLFSDFDMVSLYLMPRSAHAELVPQNPPPPHAAAQGYLQGRTGGKFSSAMSGGWIIC